MNKNWIKINEINIKGQFLKKQQIKIIDKIIIKRMRTKFGKNK
jgi:hypothetical protein